MKVDKHARSPRNKYEEPCYIGAAKIVGKSTIGAFTYFTGTANVYGADIGRYCSIADGVGIGIPEHPVDWLSSHPFAWKYDPRFEGHPIFDAMASSEEHSRNNKRTTIGNDVWIGAGAIISKGIYVGDGAIIASGAIVTKNVNPFEIVMGIPAKLHRMRFDEETIDRLIKIQWWKYFLDRQIRDCSKFCVSAFIFLYPVWINIKRYFTWMKLRLKI